MVEQQAQTVFKWSSSFLDQYSQFRPAYTDELYNIIFQFHKEHHNQWDVVHDAGTGSGVVALAFSRHFDKVIGTDPVENSIINVRQKLSTHPYADRMHFEVGRAEDMRSHISPKSVDMVTMAEAIHWTNPTLVVEAAADVLKPGGTLAIWNYGSRPFFVNNPEAEAIFEKLLNAQHGRSQMDQSVADNARYIMSSGLDTVRIDEALFKDEARWKWCTRTHKFSPPVRQLADWKPAFGGNVTVNEIDTPDMWAREVDLEWCKGYLATIHSNTDPSNAGYDALWNELKHAMGDKATVSFPATLILARKRGSSLGNL